MAARSGELPGWVNLGLLPLLNLAAAFFVSGLIVLLLGENPLAALELLLYGAFGYGEAIGYTLFYTTNFIFTGLAVAIAFHCGLFNIGGEGQAYLGGLGVDPGLPPPRRAAVRAGAAARDRWRPRCSAASGRSSRAGCRPGAAATS